MDISLDPTIVGVAVAWGLTWGWYRFQVRRQRKKLLEEFAGEDPKAKWRKPPPTFLGFVQRGQLAKCRVCGRRSTSYAEMADHYKLCIACAEKVANGKLVYPGSN